MSLRGSAFGVVLVGAILAAIPSGAVATPPSTTTSCDGTWHAQAVPAPHTYNNLYAVSATSSTDAWAVGALVDGYPGPQQPLMLHWDGSAWTEVPGPTLTSSFVQGVAEISANDAWVAGIVFPQKGGIPGATLVEHWNGTAWKRVESPTPGKKYGGSLFRAITAISSHDVWAGGDKSLPGDGATNLIEHWNGKRWKVVPTPRIGTGSSIYGMSGTSSTDVWAIGAYGDPHLRVAQTLAMHWDGTSWSVVPTPNATENANWLYAVSADAPDDAWAVGQYLDFGKPGGDLIEHWDGTAWTIVPGVQPGGKPPGLGGVAALSPTLAWAVGAQDGPPGNAATFTERWNGTTWTAVPSESPGTDVSHTHAVVALSSHLAWMAGTYTNFNDGTLYPLIERFCS